ncbi:MAG: sensor histidine kinase, partial [Verrucomicrobiales bacterium]|nr:sensor histidine kinase [Verrucomicrobiales bacterium]
MKNLILTVLLFLSISGWAAEPLSGIAEVLALSPEMAARKLPVHLRATLLVDDRFRSTFFIHDGKTGCFALIPGPLIARDPKRGECYWFDGFTNAGDFRSILEITSFQHIGPGSEPEPLRLEGDAIFNTRADAQWLEIEGRVEGSSFREGGPSLDIGVQGWVIPAFLPVEKPASPALPWHLLGRKVRVRGIAAGTFNDERQMTRRFLFLPSLSHVVPLEEMPEAATGAAAATSLLTLGSEINSRIRVRGVVTHRIEGEAVYLRDASGTLRVLTAQPLPLEPGDEIEAEGYPSLELLRPALRAGELRKIKSGPAPEPVHFDPGRPLTTRLHHELIRTTAELLAIRDGSQGFILQCRSGPENFDATVDKR